MRSAFLTDVACLRRRICLLGTTMAIALLTACQPERQGVSGQVFLLDPGTAAFIGASTSDDGAWQRPPSAPVPYAHVLVWGSSSQTSRAALISDCIADDQGRFYAWAALLPAALHLEVEAPGCLPYRSTSVAVKPGERHASIYALLAPAPTGAPTGQPAGQPAAAPLSPPANDSMRYPTPGSNRGAAPPGSEDEPS